MDATRTPPPTGRIVELKPGEKATPLMEFVPLTSEQGEKIIALLEGIDRKLETIERVARNTGF